MTLADGSNFVTKLIETVKDLPAWLYTALAVAAGILFFVPAINHELPQETRPWLIGACVLFFTLAAFKWLDILVAAIRTQRSDAKARKSIHLTVVPQQCRWSVSKQVDDSLVTQIVVAFSVKNQSPNPVGLTRARLIKPTIRGSVLEDIVTIREQRGRMYGSAHASDHRIAPGTSLPGSAVLLIRGRPRVNDGEDLSLILGISDEDGYEERISVVCKGLQGPKLADLPKAREPLHKITDPIEQGVAAVLQTEMDRYELNGRRTGGLGSLQFELGGGRKLMSFAGEARLMDTTANQELLLAPEIAMLKSDNLDSLMALHAGLTSDDERARYAAALLARLDADRGYGQVAYLIVLSLWKVGRLNDALTAACKGLPGDDRREHSMSNVLMMLNGLLRHRHQDFTAQMLDTIENALQHTTEQPFRIPKKIAAIRTLRLGAGQ